METLGQQLAEIGQRQINMALRLAAVSLESSERFMQLQTDAATRLLWRSCELFDGAVEAKTSHEDSIFWYRSSPENLERAVETGRRYLGATVEMQAELSQMWTTQLDIIAKGISQNVDQWVNAMSVASDETVAALQSLTARANEMNGLLREGATELDRAVTDSRPAELRPVTRESISKSKKSSKTA